jgi:F-type H+-transporting ATPase subunit a
MLTIAWVAWVSPIWGADVAPGNHGGGLALREGGDAHAHDHGHEPLPLYAEPIARLGPFTITNSMLVSWVVAVGLIVFARLATRRMQAVPAGAQNFWEWLVESLYEFLEGILGSELVKRSFWFFATLFILILACNWVGLLPGVGTVGWQVSLSDGTTDFRPWFRGANADLNMTFAMAMVFFACWFVWALQANGVGGFLAHLFGAKGDSVGLMKVLMVVVFFAVGILEVISIAFRPISLSFRLYGNIYAGENMLETMAAMVPNLGWAVGWMIPIPFYFLEVLVGLVQALVFMLLTAVFTLLICQHDEGHEAAHVEGRH